MTDFEVSIDKLIGLADDFDKIHNDLKSISSQANNAIRSTRWSIISKISAALSRSAVCTNINNCANDMANLSSGLREAVQYYLAYESNVSTKSFGKVVKIRKGKSSSKGEEKLWQNLIKDFGNTIIKKAEDIKSKTKETFERIQKKGQEIKNNFISTYEYLKEIYNSHGLLYDAVEYTKAGVKVIGGAAMVATGLVSLFLTGGMSTPLAVTTVIYGLNKITNGVTDGINVGRDNYDDVGNVNFLKDTLAGLGGLVGEQLGNEKVGEAIGKGVYYAGDIYITIGNLSNAIGNAKQVKVVNPTDAYSGLKGVCNTPVTKDMLFSDVGYTKWILNQNGGKDCVEFAKMISPYFSVASETADLTTGVLSDGQDLYNTVNGSDYSNLFLEKYDYYTSENPVSQAKGVIKAPGKINDIVDTYKNIYGTFKLKGA